MFKRKLVAQLTERLTEPRQFIQIVVGPRQTGKTTAVCLSIGLKEGTVQEAYNSKKQYIKTLA